MRTVKTRNAISVPEARSFYHRQPSDYELLNIIKQCKHRNIDLGRPIAELGGEHLVEFMLNNNLPTEIIKVAIDQGVPCDYINAAGKSLFATALENDDVDIAEIIIDNITSASSINDFDSEHKENAYFSVLTADISNQRKLSLLEQLLDKGANPFLKNGDGQTALMYAFEHLPVGDPSFYSVVETILGKTARTTTASSSDRSRSFLQMKDGNEKNLAFYLVDRISRASSNSDEVNSLVDLLVELNKKGMAIDDLDTSDYSPLLWACAHNSFEAAWTLLELGANHSIENIYGDTPINVAAANDNSKIIAALMAMGADFDYLNPEFPHKQAIIRAATGKKWDAVKTMVDLGADPDAQNIAMDNHSVLTMAIKDGQADTVSFLLSNKADPNLCNNHGISPLIYSIWHYKHDPESHKAILDSLISNGSDLNAVTPDGRNIITLLNESDLSDELATLVYERNVAYIAEAEFSGDMESAKKFLLKEGGIYKDLFNGAIEQNQHTYMYVQERNKIETLEKIEETTQSTIDGYQKLIGLSIKISSTVATGAVAFTSAANPALGVAAIALNLMPILTDYDSDDREAMKNAIKHCIREIDERIIKPAQDMVKIQGMLLQQAWRDKVVAIKSKWERVKAGLNSLMHILTVPISITGKKGAASPSGLSQQESSEIHSAAQTIAKGDMERDEKLIKAMMEKAMEIDPDAVSFTDEELKDAIQGLTKKREKGFPGNDTGATRPRSLDTSELTF